MQRKFLAGILSLSLVTALAAQTKFDEFKGALGTFSTSMASALAMNASIGSTWSDAYIGGFPHFGVGAVLGASTTGKGSVDPLFAAMGQSVPTTLSDIGVPLPTLGLSFKIGLPIIPADVGISGAYIPQSALASYKDSMGGVTIDYKNFAAQFRWALLKEFILIPDISVGATISYQEGTVEAPLGTSSTTLVNQSIGTDTWVVSAAAPKLSLGWKSTNVDATIQVSKSLLLLRPFLGLGLTMGSSTVTGGVASTLNVTKNGVATNTSALASAITAAGGTPPDFSTAGYLYTVTANAPVFRIYGGTSLELFILKLDLQGMYAPVTKNIGFSAMGRIQI